MQLFRKIRANSTRCSQVVTLPSTDRAQCCLTSVIGREPVRSIMVWQLATFSDLLENLKNRLSTFLETVASNCTYLLFLRHFFD